MEETLKDKVINYVGDKLGLQPGIDDITLQQVAQCFVDEFPEFILPLLEENYIAGYEKALIDHDSVMEEMHAKEEDDL